MTARARLDTPLKQHLSRNGISQAWIAGQLTERLERKVTRQEVWNWANGIHVPAEATRDEIASLLGKTAAELWPGETAALPEAA